MQCNIRADNKCSSSWKDLGSETKSTAVSLVWLSVPFTKTQNLHREPICFSSPGMNQSHSSMGPREAMLRPQKRAKKSPTLIWAGSCLYNSRCDADPWFIRRRQKIERIKDHRDDPDVWICDLWEPQTHSCLFLCDEWTSSQWTGTFLFLWEDIWCYSKGYCQSWIH